GFSTGLYETFLWFGADPVTISSITTTRITATLPAWIHDSLVTVEVIGIRSNPLPFDLTFATAGSQSMWIAIDSLDRVYWVDRAARNAIYRIEQDGSGVVTFFTTAYEITGIAFDPAGTVLC